MENQRDLSFFKKEILSESKYLTPLIIKSIKQGIWPMLKFNKEIKNLVKKRQKYLAILSNQYGFRSATVKQQIDEWLTKLDLRVFAVETVYKSFGSLTPRINNLAQKRENLFYYLEILKYNNLKHYKPDQICKPCFSKSKSNEQFFGFLTIKDRIVQTLFVQIIEPIIDVHADNNSFGFRKGRNSHQAIGVLSKLLQVKKVHPKSFNDKQYITLEKYILNTNIEQFFDKINFNWLLKNYPFPNNFVNILKEWLSNGIVYKSEYETLTTKLAKGSVIGPSLINFSLNGLEKIIASNKNFNNIMVRYVENFIIVSDNKNQIEITQSKVNTFLQERTNNNETVKSKIFRWGNNTKFDYLGFTFHYIFKNRNFKSSAKKRFNNNFGQNSLYVYPSKFKIQIFKKRIKEVIKNSLNVSPYNLVNMLNPIIKNWGDYFGVGSFEIFSRLDYYIWYRIWRYLKRKYKKVSTKNLVRRYFKGIETPSRRAWQFHGTLNCADKNLMGRKETLVWLILLGQLNKPVQANVLLPNKSLIKSSYYVDKPVFDKYNLKIIKLRSKEKKVNKWSLLYKKQQGLCDICGYSLGHPIPENLEIQDLEIFSNVNVGNSKSKDINNLRLVHTSCRKILSKFKE